MNEILLKAVKQHIYGVATKPGKHLRINGLHQLDRIIEVDQSPIGRTPRSNPATYTKMFDPIRKIFTHAEGSACRGYEARSVQLQRRRKAGAARRARGRASKRSRCTSLPDVYVSARCATGTRYNRETLEIEYRGKNIADVLEMTCEDACAFFENHPKILRFTAKCAAWTSGSATSSWGSRRTTLSGGEAQRVKLASELGKGTRYVSRALARRAHAVRARRADDGPALRGRAQAARRAATGLPTKGNTLVVIEHNLDVIKSADWIVDLGPEGGDGGGQLVACGTPEEVAATKGSHTGSFLREILPQPKKKKKRSAARASA